MPEKDASGARDFREQGENVAARKINCLAKRTPHLIMLYFKGKI
jgi:hypothetical protein